jgi:hypothetical protein
MVTKQKKSSNWQFVLVLLCLMLALTARYYLYNLPVIPGLTERSLSIATLWHNPMILVLMSFSWGLAALFCLYGIKAIKGAVSKGVIKQAVVVAAVLIGFSVYVLLSNAEYVINSGPALVMDLLRLAYSSHYLGYYSLYFGRGFQGSTTPIYPAQLVMALIIIPPLLPFFAVLMRQLILRRK